MTEHLFTTALSQNQIGLSELLLTDHTSKTRAVRGSDCIPALGLLEQNDILVTENWRD